MKLAFNALSLRWAANGALAGTGAAAVLIWVDKLQYHAPQNLVFVLLPGTTFGLVVSIPLWRRGLAAGWWAAVFVAGSIIAWPAAYYAGVRVLVAIETTGPSRLALAGLAGGLVWSAILTAALLVLPFIRARRVRFVLPVAGGLTGALCVSMLEFLGQWGFGAVYIVLWGVWYAVQGGLIAMALPRD
ncbi:MAG: hypothetical protein IMF08_13200 [Proteobacteria bacterium]|nr:hypothetical protein [Pseudomonadota bacterium]